MYSTIEHCLLEDNIYYRAIQRVRWLRFDRKDKKWIIVGNSDVTRGGRMLAWANYPSHLHGGGYGLHSGGLRKRLPRTREGRTCLWMKLEVLTMSRKQNMTSVWKQQC